MCWTLTTKGGRLLMQAALAIEGEYADRELDLINAGFRITIARVDRDQRVHIEVDVLDDKGEVVAVLEEGVAGEWSARPGGSLTLVGLKMTLTGRMTIPGCSRLKRWAGFGKQ